MKLYEAQSLAREFIHSLTDGLAEHGWTSNWDGRWAQIMPPSKDRIHALVGILISNHDTCCVLVRVYDNDVLNLWLAHDQVINIPANLNLIDFGLFDLIEAPEVD